MTLYSLVLTIHISTAITLIGTVLIADHYALSWVRGKRETLPHTIMARIHYGMYIGLGIMVLSGIYMFLPIKEYLLYEVAFQIKMGFLVALILNSVLIGQLLHTSTHNSFASLTKKTQLVFSLSGGASSISWASIIIGAQFLGV